MSVSRTADGVADGASAAGEVLLTTVEGAVAVCVLLAADDQSAVPWAGMKIRPSLDAVDELLPTEFILPKSPVAVLGRS